MKSRLDKILAANGFGSRKDVKRILHTSEVSVNGLVRRDAATIVDPEIDTFAIDGIPLKIRTSVYLMLNKPAGVVTSTNDPDHRTVMDLLSEPYSQMDLFPVGRLDRDTEGLLLITNDGPLAHALTSPKTGVEKTYFARLRDPVDPILFEEYTKRFLEDITFKDGYTCLPAKLFRDTTVLDEVSLTIHEGKYHQVKKMFMVLGNEVIYLRRVSMGAIVLDPALESGMFRELTDDEIQILRKRGGQNDGK